MKWYYLKLNLNGRLVDELGNEANLNWPSFKSTEEAEIYLNTNNIRASVCAGFIQTPSGQAPVYPNESKVDAF